MFPCLTNGQSDFVREAKLRCEREREREREKAMLLT